MGTYTLDEVMKEGGKKTYKLTEVMPESEPFGKQLNRELSSIPRQLGLTARYGMEGLGSIPEIIGNAMEGAGVKGAGGNFGTTVSNYIGLPKPESSMEKVIAEPTRLMAGTAGFGGLANTLAKSSSPATQAMLERLSANQGMQQASAAGAGLAGGYTKETGGDGASQFVASLAGGLAAPMSVQALSGLPQKVGNAAKSAVEYVAPGIIMPSVTNVDVIINNVLRDSGITAADIPANVLQSLRGDVATASKSGDLSQDALRRLIDYRTVGATPLRGNLTLNPGDITREQNLSKIGANSTDPVLQSLSERSNTNNAALIERLNGIAPATGDKFSTGEVVTDALKRNDNYSKWVIDNLYGAARNTEGRSAMLDPAHFSQTANNLLDDALLGGKLPSDVRNLLNKTAMGDMPLTVDVAEQFKTRLGALQRASNDPAERLALGKVREALEGTPLVNGQGQKAIDAFNTARKANAGWMGEVERTPALAAVRDGVEPDRFVQQFIIGNGKDASVMSVAQLKNQIKDQPQAMESVRGQIVSFIKEKALNGATDEVGKIGQSSLNKAINEIGDRKLNLFFSKEEINQLKAIGRVSSYEQVQPIGSAVNNSNTSGATIGTMLDKLSRMPLLGKIPLGREFVGQPMQNIVTGINAGQATNVPSSLLLPMQKKPSMLPNLMVPGLLSTQN